MLERVRTTRALFAGFIAFYIIATALLGATAYWVSNRALTRQLEERIAAEASLLDHIHRQGGASELQAALQRRDDRGVNALGYLFLDRHGRRIGGELNLTSPPPGWQTAQITDPEGRTVAARILTTDLAGGARLTVASETAPIDQLEQTLARLFVAGAIVMLIGGIGGAYAFSRQLHHKLSAMNDTALAIIRGDMSQRVPIGPQGDEFDRLADTLNRMLDRNAALIGNLRQVSSDIAHDLRTPIAHLAQGLERALARRPDVEAMEREIEAAIDQSVEILSLFAAMLRISEVESGALRRYFLPFELSAEVRRLCESYQAVAEDSDHVLRWDIEDGLMLVGDRELVLQALINLLENALRHTPTRTLVTVRLARSGDAITLAVCDDGPGVPAEQIPHLTDRFKRGDRARTTAGFGLGLNLAKAIAQMHEGQLVLESSERGFSALIRLRTAA